MTIFGGPADGPGGAVVWIAVRPADGRINRGGSRSQGWAKAGAVLSDPGGNSPGTAPLSPQNPASRSTRSMKSSLAAA